MNLRYIFGFFIIFTLFFGGSACRTQNSNIVTIANSDKFSSLDTISTTSPDSAADRVRVLIYNSLVKKNENFEYVGDLAKEINIGDDNLT
nr:hypothetical protein [Acidobacteriota bacterium]